MRICLIYIPAKKNRGEGALARAAAAMGRVFAEQGHELILAEAGAEQAGRLSFSDYIVVGTESAGFFGGLPKAVKTCLAQAGQIAGKRSMAFTLRRGLFSAKTLARLMAAMEAQAMFVNFAELVKDENQAARAALAAPVERRR